MQLPKLDPKPAFDAIQPLTYSNKVSRRSISDCISVSFQNTFKSFVSNSIKGFLDNSNQLDKVHNSCMFPRKIDEDNKTPFEPQTGKRK